jgi:hypothetical protein
MSWSQIGSDIPGETNNDEFGGDTSINGDGTIVAFSAKKGDDGGTDSGEIEVWKYNSGTSAWEQMGSDIPGESADDRAGCPKLNNAGTRVVFGEPLNDVNEAGDSGSLRDGSVKVYDYDSGSDSWSQVGSDIDPNPLNQGEQFGNRVGINSAGNRIIVGARYWDDGGATNTNKGYAEVYEYSGGSWSLLGARIEGPCNKGNYGTGVDINATGDRIVIGGEAVDQDLAGNNDNEGLVQVYEYSDSSWSQLGANLFGDAGGDRLGSNVYMNNAGDRILACSRSGLYAKVYEYSSGSWSQLGSNLSVTTTNSPIFQGDINGAGNVVVIGDPNVSSERGQVKVYKYNTGTSAWDLVSSAIDGGATGDLFGVGVAINDQGDYISAGAKGVGTDKGEGYVYYNSSLAASSGGGGKITVKSSGKVTIKGTGKMTVK